MDRNGGITWATPTLRRFVTYAGNYPTAVESDNVAPTTFTVRSRGSNPFGQGASIEYALPMRARVVARVVDVSGRTVRAIDVGDQEAGIHSLGWDGRTDSDQRPGAGVYFLVVDADGEKRSLKVILLK